MQAKLRAIIDQQPSGVVVKLGMAGLTYQDLVALCPKGLLHEDATAVALPWLTDDVSYL